MRETKSQYSQKLNVWAGIIGTHIIGPFFIDGTLTAEKYLTMLRDDIVPAIRNIFDLNFETVWFQQDGAPSHFELEVRNFLNDTFAERWIGRRGTRVATPITRHESLGFFLLGLFKRPSLQNQTSKFG